MARKRITQNGIIPAGWGAEQHRQFRALRADGVEFDEALRRVNRGWLINPDGEVAKAYSGASDDRLPPAVQRMSATARAVWVATFNRVLADGASEDRAFALAYTAARRFRRT